MGWTGTVGEPADITNYTAVFRLQQPGGAHPRKVVKRNRQPVSCAPCRARKLKCDRQQPCGACVKRSEEGACNFSSAAAAAAPGAAASAAPAATNGGSSSAGKAGPSGSGSRHEVQSRLQRLEEMVNGLVSHTAAKKKSTSSSSNGGASQTPESLQVNSAGQEGSPAKDTSTEPQMPGAHLSTGDEEIRFVGTTNWAAVLESIRDIQGYLEGEHEGLPILMTPDEQQCVAGRSDNPDMLFGYLTAPSIQEVMECLPPRADCDHLLAAYFLSDQAHTPIIHTGQFKRVYQRFWESPESTNLLWISILFNVLATSTLLQAAKTVVCNSLIRDDNIQKFTNMASRCLVAGEYLKSKPYAVEALLLHTQGSLMQKRDPDPIICSMFGIATRLAQRMGYHRDPRHLGAGVTAFEAEMRRRTWYMAETFDLLFSFQQGMPTIVHEDECDTDGPTNLRDEDFDEDTSVLPPGRPFTEATPVLYYCYKSPKIRLLRRVIRHAMSSKQTDYEETWKLSNELQALHDRVPPSLRWVPISTTSFLDTGTLIMRRMTIEVVYWKSLCVLHRRYLTVEKDNPKYERSREICRAAAVRLLELQAEFDDETQRGRRLEGGMYLMSNLSMHDFLMAAMIVCLDLSEKLPSSETERTRKVEILQRTYKLWSNRICISKDAAHATRVLGAILTKISAPVPKEPMAPVQYVTFASPREGELNIDWNLIDSYLWDRAPNPVDESPLHGWPYPQYDTVAPADTSNSTLGHTRSQYMTIHDTAMS
ncbi:putative fungal specific transcription factor domain-containing protein [Phaeoacremonium minimum UCRPA7]|uniref:Putative fungal specific transcription factor domain-containing protein n=1 Tax=Phaeoacremonium minimum (strain UCR-PA7) TaxID=1286976 RepID=R8BM02_PHAM7|nr:putative fungal specific transcription factor domain-containing protein [Phaeoacremonium minimum UCRPA7]EOO00357.1 putative fungal specific transcription factor domain-containing protein [Phaeoacremonium minimum UCRPA7]